MVVDRRHAEDASTEHAEGEDLPDDRERLHDVETAEKDEEELRIGEEGESGERPSQGL